MSGCRRQTVSINVSNVASVECLEFESNSQLSVSLYADLRIPEGQKSKSSHGSQVTVT